VSARKEWATIRVAPTNPDGQATTRIAAPSFGQADLPKLVVRACQPYGTKDLGHCSRSALPPYIALRRTTFQKPSFGQADAAPLVRNSGPRSGRLHGILQLQIAIPPD